MTTRIIPVDAEAPDPAAIEEAASIILAGGIVAFPTETVYGLGANALDPDAVAAIFDAKGRPKGNPLILHVSSFEAARELAAEWPEPADRLIESFWPGPLTLVLRRSEIVPDIVTAGLDTFGVRMPAHPVARALIREAGVPIAAPSANPYMAVSPTRAEHVAMSLGDRLPLILDGGQTDVGIESTVVQITDDQVTLLRPGIISAVDIEQTAGVPLQRLAAIVPEGQPQRSPGRAARHYAPRGRVIVGGAEEIQRLPRATPGLAVLFEERPVPANVEVVAAPDTPRAYAHDLYEWLHRADETGAVFIFFETPPDTPAWEAIRDRLTRASHE